LEGGGGGGGAGGYGAIVNSGTYTNVGTVQGGSGGAGGASSAISINADGGSGGIGVYLSGTSNLVNSGTVSRGVGGSAGTGGTGGLSGISAPGVYVASSSISSITNSGTVIGGNSDAGAITNAGQLSALTNTNLINGTNGIYNSGTIGFISNLGSDSVIVGMNQSIYNIGTIQYLENSGQLRNAYNGIYNVHGAVFTSLNNSGSITGDASGISNLGSVDNILNSGSISANTAAINNGNSGNIGSIINTTNGVIISVVSGVNNYVGFIAAITNSGSITGDTSGIQNFGSIGTITNTGNITSSTGYGISNDQTTDFVTEITYRGSIQTLNNGQGSASSGGVLTYNGILPSNYNIIINSKTNYGQIAVSNGTGALTFGISSSSTVTKGTYTSVITGVGRSNLSNLAGNLSGFTWLLNNSSGSIWDLVVTGAATVDTQQSRVNTASVLQNTYTLQNSVLANSFSYDCNVFGANNVCVSAGGRNTQVQAANGLNNTSALLIAAYRPHPNYRIGAYADQNLSVSNPGGTVNLGNNTPLIGLFGAWNQRLDGTGIEVKVSAAYGQKNATISRQVVGTSEAGTGSSQLNSQGAQVTAKYGFGIMNNVIVSPYVGMRYTQNNMGGYTEGASSSVTAPLTYAALNTNATTALAGVGASYRFIPKATAFASAGVETDTNTSSGTYSATGITGLTSINFNANPVKTRPTATLGAYYDIEKNQRIGVTGIYRQEAYQAVSTTAVMATYTIGL
jgi:hypothetical protein